MQFYLDPAEEKEVIETTRDVMENQVRKHFKWICVPLLAEFSITKVNGSWADKEEIKEVA